jgi:nitrogen fixation NifU-like protein
MPSPEFAFHELDDLYQEIILDHYRSPRNARNLENPSVIADGNNPFCGDETHIELIVGAGKTIQATGIVGRGCSISQASASLMSELVTGKTAEELSTIVQAFRDMMQGKEISAEHLDLLKDTQVLAGVRQFPVRVKCALLPWVTLLDGV